MYIDTSKLPDIVVKNCNRFYFVGAGLFAAGIIAAIIIKTLSCIVAFALLGLAFAILGKLKLYHLSKVGCLVITGKCIKVEQGIKNTIKNKANLRSEPDRFIIKGINPLTETEEKFVIPYYKNGVILDEDDKVNIYYYGDARFTEKGGLLSSADFITYEIC